MLERKQSARTRGGTVKLSLTFSRGLLDRVDELASIEGLSRSAMVSRLVRRSLPENRATTETTFAERVG